MKFSASYCIVVGILMLAQWIFFLVTGQVPELNSEPLRIAFHLAAEGITALALIYAGIGLFRQRTNARSIALVALGMLVYTTIVSPGYFAQQGVWPLVIMFAVLLALALVAAGKLISSPSR